MPEHDCLPPDVTATEFVTHLGRMSGLPPTAAKERAAESLRHVGLHEERYRLIGTYSTGMKQRVKLAQALVGRPPAAAAGRADQRPGPGRPHRHARADRPDRRRSSASRSWSPRTCSARSSGSATTWSRSKAGGCCGPTPSTSFTRASQVLAGRGRGGPRAAAAGAGRPRPAPPPLAQRTLLVPLGGDDTYDVVRDAVADLGLPLCRLEQRRHQVEELFRDEAGGAER